MDNSTNKGSTKWNKWNELFSEIKRRFSEPWYEPYFVFYLLVVVILIGGSGVIASFIEAINTQDWDGFTKSLGTYYFAIIGSALVEVNIVNIYKKDDSTFLLIALLFFLISGAFLAWIFFSEIPYTFIPAFGGLALGLVMWVFANADDKKSKPKSADTTGGDESKDLNGSTEGFEE